MTNDHFISFGVSVERAEETIKEYEATTKGQRFIKTLEESKKFRKKYDEGLLSSDAMYMTAGIYSGRDDLFSLLMDAYNLGYRKGYNKAQRTERAKRKGETS